jgi:hypothetical protein
MRELVERVWFGEDIGSRMARAALAAPELFYRAAVGLRGALYDAGVF